MTNRSALILLTGGWLAFLVVSLGAATTYLLQAPIPIGPGMTKVFGFGALAGLTLGAATPFLCAPLFSERTKLGRLKVAFGCIVTGAFGGAGVAAWTNQLRVVKTHAVELPIVEIQQLPSRRRASSIQIATLLPLDPTGQDHVSAEYIDGPQIRAGDCLKGIIEHGWLGGAWVRRYSAKPCSMSRGNPGPNVIVPDGNFSSWRWHNPRNYRLKRRGQAWDDAMPVNLTCRLRPQSWIYRCSSRQ